MTKKTATDRKACCCQAKK